MQKKFPTFANRPLRAPADRIPFTIFQCLVPIGGEAEFNLRNNGLSLINASRSYKSLVDNIELRDIIKSCGLDRKGAYPPVKYYHM